MKTAVLEALNSLVVKDLPEPEIGADEALLKVEAAAICGSDLRILRHGNPRVQTPAVIGHEGAGTVVKCGRDVTRVKEGDRVAIGADVPCGQCRWCRDGLGNNCGINYAVGYQIPGVFTQYMKLPRLLLEEGPVTPIGNGLTFEDAALAEPLACAINGLEIAGMALGKSVVIMGLGPIGCMLIDLARTMGASKVIAVQRSAKRMALAQVYEADAYIASESEDVVARCRQETHGEGPDIVITACGSVEAHEQAIEMVAHRGTVNLFGGLGRDARPLSVLSNVIHYKECFVTGSHGCVPRHHELAVRLIEQGRVRVKPLITHRFGLERINEAFEAMASRQAMKVILQPHCS
jgi:L-iditol 2-dehydrogenase